jgi:hypothetical protein
MIDLLLQVIYISLFCLGWHTITSEGMIFYFIRTWLDKRIPQSPLGDLIYKPLIGCSPCMASFWGSICYWILNYPTREALILWIPTIIAVSYANKLLLITDDDR